ncbi:MAG: transposase [Anaerolineae bacterium]|nr:transposase [Anaerolineae bacterium]
MVIRDEHGSLLFSIRLKLGLRIKVFYVDFWLAYPLAIKAVYPEAHIQYDFFHTIQNIHRHLYKALTAYRQAFKAAATEPAQAEVRKVLHKHLWHQRYLLFTNEENLSAEHHQILDELLQSHADTIVEYIVLFWQQLRTIFNDCDTFVLVLDHLALLRLDGWADLSAGFGKVMAFLEAHIHNMLTYLRVPDIQRYSLSECTVRTLRRVKKVRQGFKTHQGRVNHLKLLQWRRDLRHCA